jgi:Fe-S oxidoreductase
MGCCGMAGSFGFESKHYKYSMAIGELNLLPAIRIADPKVWLIVDGFSCRSQIMDGTGKKPMHLAEAVHRALGL